MNNLAVTVAWVLGVLFLGPTIMGLIQNFLFREHVLLIFSTAHNFVYLVTAIGFAVVAILGTKASVRYMQVFGVVYILMSLFEFVTLSSNGESYQLGITQIYFLSNALHLSTGITIAGAGWILKNCQRRMIFANRAIW